MKQPLKYSLIVVCLLALVAVEIYRTLPVERIDLRSQLIMLGDLNGDNAWNKSDSVVLGRILQDPFNSDNLTLVRIDVNRNQMIDAEDTSFLSRLYSCSDPYAAQESAISEHVAFPRPRELFKYLPEYEYVQSPVFVLKNGLSQDSPFDFIENFNPNTGSSDYEHRLLWEVYSEGMRFTSAYRKREAELDSVERSYANQHIQNCNQLFAQKEYYVLLLNLIGLVEDAETLRYGAQSEFVRKSLYFRDHLRDLLTSPEFQAYEAGTLPSDSILRAMERLLHADLRVDVRLDTLPSPRDLFKIDNYVDRIEWQKYKSQSKKDDFLKLLLFAQYDRRYLRAVSMTSRKHSDLVLDNHNLPMILLFREALQICNGSKKAAVGMLDEALRIPFAWVKSIPRNILPSSVALENFLLPGNMEDGSDKSRHWNVFGGIALYRTPQESLILALQREVSDLKGSKPTPEQLREFIRDTISNINGIYYVMSIDENLIRKDLAN